MTLDPKIEKIYVCNDKGLIYSFKLNRNDSKTDTQNTQDEGFQWIYIYIIVCSSVLFLLLIGYLCYKYRKRKYQKQQQEQESIWLNESKQIFEDIEDYNQQEQPQLNTDFPNIQYKDSISSYYSSQYYKSSLNFRDSQTIKIYKSRPFSKFFSGVDGKGQYVRKTMNQYEIDEEEFQNRYKFLGFINNGGSFSSVFKYLDQFTDRKVAVKQITATVEEDLQENLNEALILKSLQSNDFIVKLQKYCLISKPNLYQFQIVMELGETTLMEKINEKIKLKQEFQSKELISCLKELIFAMKYLHDDLKIPHRDIKPSNIIFIKNKLKLSDFRDGFKKVNNNIRKSIDSYLSPQAYQKLKYFDQEVNEFKNDVFSVGLTLLHMILLIDIQGFNQDQNILYNSFRIAKNKNKYPKYVYSILKKMLVWDQEKRIAFKDAYGLIVQYESNEIQN